MSSYVSDALCESVVKQLSDFRGKESESIYHNYTVIIQNRRWKAKYNSVAIQAAFAFNDIAL